MPSKDKALRLIDQPGANKAAADVQASAPVTTSPRIDLLPSPTGLTVTGQNVYRSSANPSIIATVQWTPDNTVRFDSFILQYATTNTFVDAESVASTDNTESIVLKPNTTYYLRVASVAGLLQSQWSTTYSFTTMLDTTIPPNLASMTLDWSKGDLLITVPFTNSEAIKDVRLRIYNQAQSVLYKEVYTSAPFIYTADENIRAGGGTPITTLTIVAHSRSWSNVISASGITQTTTSTPPGTISGLTTNWNGDTGTAAADLIITWNPDSNSSQYVVEFNNNSALRYTTVDDAYVYPWTSNAKDNPPSGLFTMPVRVWGINKLAQSGVAASVTHTNAAPTTTGAGVIVTTGFSQVIAVLTHTQILDVDRYRYTLSGATLTTIESTAREITLPMPAEGNYVVTANIIDRFGRISNNITSSLFYTDVLTISGLRSAAIYRDSQGTAAATLNALKDDVLITNAITHNNSTVSSRWTEFERPLLDRYKTTTIAISGAMRFYLRTQRNDGGFDYWAGPLTQNRILTKYSSVASAETNFVTHSGLITRYDLPETAETRFIRMYHWNPAAATYGLAEYYPRRLVQSDDIEAETIKTINIGAGQVTADRIFVLNLAAVNAATGNLTVSGVLTIADGGGSGLYQGTGTFASPTTGLRIWRDGSSIGRLTTYNAGTVQVDINTSGQLTAGAGNVIADNSGIRINSINSPSPTIQNGFTFFTGSTNLGGVFSTLTTTGLDNTNNQVWQANAVTGYDSQIYIRSAVVSGRTAGIRIQAVSGSGANSEIKLTMDGISIAEWASIGNAGSLSRADGNRALVLNQVSPATATHMAWSFSGTEKWVMGVEPGSSDRFIMYNNPVGYAFVVRKSDNLFNVAGSLATNGTTVVDAVGVNNVLRFGSESSAEFMLSDRTNAYGVQFGLILATAGTPRILINNAQGNIAIGNFVPSASTRLIVRGQGNTSATNAFVCQNSDGTNILIVRNDGASNQIWSNWTLISSTDEKSRVSNDSAGLNELLQLKPKKYGLRRLRDAKVTFKGFLVEEFESIFPDLVDDIETAEGEYKKGIRYGDLIPVIVRAVQELNDKIEKNKK